jgi:hypothetical protein
MQTRRSFVKTAGLVSGTALAGGSFLGVSTCTTIEQDILNYVPVALSSFDEILTLINPAEAAALAVIISAVKVAFADVQAAVITWENAPSANKATLACKLVLALQIAEQTLQQFFNQLNLPVGSLLDTVEGIIQIVLSTLEAFIPSLNCATPPPAVKAFQKTVAVVAKKRTVSQFKKDINNVLVQHKYAPIYK